MNAVTDALVLQDNGYYKNFSGSNTDGGTAFSSGDVLSIAVDLDANTFTFRQNNTQIVTGTIGGTAGRELVPVIISYDGQYGVMDCNFGQRPFAYTAPSGFKALCTANLPAPVVTKPSTVMDVALYTGNGGTNTITGLGFSPDLVWLKGRSSSSRNNLYDVIRDRKALFSDGTDAELSLSAGVDFGTFNSDGFTLLTPSATAINNSGQTFVAWTWDAGSSTVTNTAGSISSQVRANASAGFSIVTYTGNGTAGATVGHGLGVAPQLIIIKARNNVSGGFWQVYHQAIGNTKYLELNSTSAAGTSSNRWNNTTPSSTVFTLGSDSDLNGSLNYVAYCFAPVAGYANAFSYTGTGGEGPMVYLGMRPRLVLIKRTDSTGSWFLFDAARSPYNETRKYLLAESSAAEGDDGDITNGWQLDFLSNGFKIRADAALQLNANGGTYVGFAWAESPFQYARAR
jgi:hypothetical protein